jgi:hypothetical protein
MMFSYAKLNTWKDSDSFLVKYIEYMPQMRTIILSILLETQRKYNILYNLVVFPCYNPFYNKN